MQLSTLESIWNSLEVPFNDPPQFYNWFITNCKQTVEDTMLRPIRIAAGLGNPPEPYYTNDVESQNNVIKHQVSYKTQELPQFVSSMQAMMEAQRREVERASIGMGEYQLAEEYQYLKIEARKIFQTNF